MRILGLNMRAHLGAHRRNPWGNMSYADLITQAITQSPDQRLTLAQIYDWLIKNIPHFRDKSDSVSSTGWKVGKIMLFTWHTYVVKSPDLKVSLFKDSLSKLLGEK